MRLNNMKKVLAGLCLSLGLIANANAGLINVKSIEVSNGIGEWLQVAEVVALDMLGDDMALTSAGAIASAADWWDARTLPINAIDGNTAGSYGLGQIFHEGNPRTGDTLTIELSSVVELASIQIFGRTDCCQARDFYNVSFFDEQGSELFSTSVDSRFQSSPVIALPDTSVAVPNPATLALMIIGFVGLSLSRKLKR